MPKATFETLEGEEIEIDSSDVVNLTAGDEEETTVIELEDGEDVTVVATPREVAADLRLNLRDFIDEDEDDAIEVDDEEEERDD